MRIEVSKKLLLERIRLAGKAANKKAQYKTLGHVLIRAVDTENISITATDLDMTIVAGLQCTSVAVGKDVCVPIDGFRNAINAVTSENVIIEIDDAKALVGGSFSRGSAAVRLGANPAEYPVREVLGDMPGAVVVAGDELAAAIDCTAFAVAKQSVQFAMTGVHFSVRDGRLYVAATDTHKLATVSMPVINCDAGALDAVIPLAPALLLKDIAGGAELVRISASENSMWCNTSGTYYDAIIINGRFPQWRNIIPAHAAHVKIAKDDLVKAFDAVTPFTPDLNHACTVRIEGETITIDTVCDSGTCSIGLHGESNSDRSVKLQFDAAMLAECVKHAQGDMITVGFADARSVVSLDAGDAQKMVVMPLSPSGNDAK